MELSLIRVIDNYTRFYFRCIKPNRAAVERGAAWLPAGSEGIHINGVDESVLEERYLREERALIRTPDYWR